MIQHLIIAPINEKGELMALYPHEYHNLGVCTIDEFRKTTERSLEAQKIANTLNTLQTENAIRLKQIFDSLCYAGIITSKGIEISPFLRPYFEKFIIEHEAKQTFWQKWKMKQAHKHEVFMANVKSVGMGLVSQYGTKTIMWFRKKFGK